MMRIKLILAIAGILTAFGIAGTLDYQDACRQEASCQN